MKNLELILPFSIPPSGLENDLLKAMQTPALARLIASAKRMPLRNIDPFSKALVHEYFLANELQGAHDCDPPVTLNRMRDMGLQPVDGRWFTLQPVHIHIARDHLVLTDQRRLDISEQESRVLFEIAKTATDEAGMTLQYGDASTWFLRADGWTGLKTASADAACGHNVDIWMPDGEHARAWRKLQNEIQMMWFAHTLNDEREAQGKNHQLGLAFWWCRHTDGTRKTQAYCAVVCRFTVCTGFTKYPKRTKQDNFNRHDLRLT
jgi:hypothetical protein